MNQLNHFSHPLALFTIFLLFSASSAHKKPKESPSTLPENYKNCFNKIYAFGDSSTSKEKPPQGSGNSNQPTASISCDGRLIIDFLCDSLSIPPLPCFQGGSFSKNFSFGVNFAIAGSTALPGKYLNDSQKSHPNLWTNVAVNLQTQMQWFDKFVKGMECKGKDAIACKADIGKSLFWIGAMGVNDYARSMGSFPLQRLSKVSVLYLSKQIQALIDCGAKNIVVQGLPPIGCLPLGLSSCPLKSLEKTGCAGPVNAAVMIHNQILQKKLEKFKMENTHCNIIYADYWNAYMEILMNLGKYHFEEPFKACCGAGGGKFNFDMNSLCGSKGASTCNNPSKHIVWDGIHLTEAMNMQITNLFLHQGFCKPSFASMVQKNIGV